MPREMLRIPCPIAEIVLLEHPEERYGIEIYWREGGYYESLFQADNLEAAQTVIMKVAEKLLSYI